MADREFERADWLGNISRGLRIVAWAALVGGIGANALAFLIPIVGGTRGGLWISRYWSIAFEAVALIGLVATTHPPPVNDAKPVWTTTATVLRVLGGAAVISHLVVALLVDIGVDHDIRMVAGLSFRLLSLAAHVLLVWYVGGMLRRFGAVGTARALRWSAYALEAIPKPDICVLRILVHAQAHGRTTRLVGGADSRLRTQSQGRPPAGGQA